jgi:glycosyltransferase involved in cell wall biosynthesis
MRFALLVEYYPPSRASAAVQMCDLARALARDGHEITVFTTSPDAAMAALEVETDGVKVLRVPTGKSKGVGLVRRALSEIFMSLALWRGARRCRVDVEHFDGIVWYSPTILLGPFVAWLKRRSGANGYLILRDIFPQWALDAGVMRRGPVYYFFRACELFQYRVANVIGVQSPANLSVFAERARRSQHIEVLYNWIDLSRPEPASSDLIERHGLTGKRILVYGGNMGVAQDVENLLRLARRIREHTDVALLLIGSGSETDRLNAAIAGDRLDNVVLADEIPAEAFRSVLRCCHVGLITLDRRLTTHNIPGKLLAYLEAGLPVVASVNAGNDLLDIIHEAGVGVGLVNGDDEAFARAAVEVVRDPQRCAAIAANARALARERFSVEAVVRQLVARFPAAGELRRARAA